MSARISRLLELSSELSSGDAFIRGRGALVAGTTQCATLEHLLHRCPVCLDPASVVATVAVRRNADLREAQLRALADPLQLKIAIE